jgi:hypothetical protein
VTVVVDIPDALVEQFTTLEGAKELAEWSQGDLIAGYIEEVYPDVQRDPQRAKFYQDFGMKVGKSHDTIRIRHKTSVAFPPAARSADHAWTIHALCTRQATKSKGGKYDYSVSHAWLDFCKLHFLGQTELKNVIQFTGGNIALAKALSGTEINRIKKIGRKAKDPAALETIIDQQPMTLLRVNAVASNLLIHLPIDLPASLREGETLLITLSREIKE